MVSKCDSLQSPQTMNQSLPPLNRQIFIIPIVLGPVHVHVRIHAGGAHHAVFISDGLGEALGHLHQAAPAWEGRAAQNRCSERPV